jgi:hypothetical protein
MIRIFKLVMLAVVATGMVACSNSPVASSLDDGPDLNLTTQDIGTRIRKDIQPPVTADRDGESRNPDSNQAVNGPAENGPRAMADSRLRSDGASQGTDPNATQASNGPEQNGPRPMADSR